MIRLNSKLLNEALARVSPAIPSRSSIQCLSGVVLSSDHNQLSVSATNLDTWISAFVDAEGDLDKCVVNASKLKDITSKIKCDIEIEFTNGAVWINADNGYRGSISTFDINDYPSSPVNSDSQVVFSVDKSKFTKHVAIGSFAASTDQSRAALCNSLLICKDGVLTITATDGHRLGTTSLRVESGDFSVMIPAKALMASLKEIDGDTVEVSVSANIVVITGNSICVKIITAQGSYPDWEKSIPKEFEHTMPFRKSVFKEAIDMVSGTMSRETSLVKIHWRDNGAVFMSKDIGTGSSSEFTLPIEWQSDELIMGLNSSIIMSALSHTPEEFTLYMNGPIKPVVIRSSDETYTILVMPLRIFD